jgi:hypothetical protein
MRICEDKGVSYYDMLSIVRACAISRRPIGRTCEGGSETTAIVSPSKLTNSTSYPFPSPCISTTVPISPRSRPCSGKSAFSKTLSSSLIIPSSFAMGRQSQTAEYALLFQRTRLSERQLFYRLIQKVHPSEALFLTGQIPFHIVRPTAHLPASQRGIVVD